MPIVLGAVQASDVADLIEPLLGEESLIVVSSDLSHYLPYDQARGVDAETAARILAVEPTLDHEAACGATAINALLVVARRCALTPRLVDLRSSGDTAGGREEVVGYGGFTFARSGA